jgi:hypothetical protein
VEDVQAFGDRLHLRVGEEKAETVLRRLPAEIRSAGGEIADLRLIPPALEDVFIALSDHDYVVTASHKSLNKPAIEVATTKGV